MYRADIVRWTVRLLRRAARGLVERPRDPASAYDSWSSVYDGDETNLLVYLDERLFVELLGRVDLRDKVVVDVGCGTGRHWDEILARRPSALVGYDASRGMLARLHRKYPGATTHLSSSHVLAHTRAGTCDLVVSTLALSHIRSARAALKEWSRVLRVGGEVVLTDFHPAAASSSETTFRHGERVVKVKSYVRSLASIESAVRRAGLEPLALEERVIDASMRPHYERAHMEDVFERMRGLALIYGMHLRKIRRGGE
jgi:ubiquinone/menaquinone biosynthesis C-methylase UbiE